MSGAHRMADPAVRLRAALVAGVLVTLSWGSLRIAGRPGGPFGSVELRDLSGIPVAPPQIEERTPPVANPLGDLAGQMEDLYGQMRAATASPAPATKGRR